MTIQYRFDTRLNMPILASWDPFSVIQSMYSSIAHQLQVGTSLIWRHNLVRFQISEHFWIPRPKLHGAM